MTTEARPQGLAMLREPFPSHQISKLPKQVKRGDEDKGKCEQGSRYSADGYFCGGWHARSIHLDYVGHAALTDRLLEADPEWSWEPVAFDQDGLPAFDRNGGLWIRLTVCGVTRLGYGDAQGKQGGNAVKEAIGDALRNAGMRFGAALDLWHKGDLHDNGPEAAPDPSVVRAQIAALASARGESLDAVAEEFLQRHGCPIAEGSVEQLTAFLAAFADRREHTTPPPAAAASQDAQPAADEHTAAQAVAAEAVTADKRTLAKLTITHRALWPVMVEAPNGKPLRLKALLDQLARAGESDVA